MFISNSGKLREKHEVSDRIVSYSRQLVLIARVLVSNCGCSMPPNNLPVTSTSNWPDESRNAPGADRQPS
jgi:hypothetical protein